MASEVKANKLSPSSGTALQIGDASDTITIPTGATFTITDGLPVASGGTGLASFTAGDILYASGTTTLAKLAKGTAEQVLAMNSGATAPDWGSVDLTVLPTITAAKGGTGQTSYTAGDIVYASGTTAISKLGKGTGLQVLQTNSGATAPEWANSPQSLMTAAGDILYASGANTLAKLAKGSDDEVLTLASGVPSWAASAGGGAWALIESKTASADSVIDFTTLSTDYRDFMLIGSGIRSTTNAVDPWMRYSVSTSFVTTGSTYQWGCWGWDIANSGGAAGGDGATQGWGQAATSYIRLESPYQTTNGMGTTAGYNMCFSATIFDVHDTGLYTMSTYHTNLTQGGLTPAEGKMAYCTGGGQYKEAVAIDGLRFQFSSGNVSEGMFTLYGRATA